MRFSQRVGEEELNTELQVRGADKPLRVALWNVSYRYLVDRVDSGSPEVRDDLLQDIWEYFFKRALDEIPPYLELLARMKAWLMECDWHRMYDFVEFLWSILPPTSANSFASLCNKALESERSAYRFVRDRIMPITDAMEIRELTDAVERTGAVGLEVAQELLARALDNLALRETPDYDRAVLESVYAVRIVAKGMAGDEHASVADAFGALDPEGILPERLGFAATALFGENAKGEEATHLFDEGEADVTLAEARFMILAASATINYLLSLAGNDPVTVTTQLRDNRSLGEGPAD